jgi:long-subunit acyl-CoA synthetase (AMP-forming)
MARHFPNAIGLAVYGNTEAEPIAVMQASELARDESDFGYLLGKLIPEISCSIRAIPDLKVLSTDPMAPVGHLVVTGPHAVGGEVNTGDIVGLDKLGRLFLLGRQPDLLRNRLGSLIPPLPIEKRLSHLLGQWEIALVQSSDHCTLYVEGLPVRQVAARQSEIMSVLNEYSISARVVPIRVLPRDSRQRSKIDRAALRLQG